LNVLRLLHLQLRQHHLTHTLRTQLLILIHITVPSQQQPTTYTNPHSPTKTTHYHPPNLPHSIPPTAPLSSTDISYTSTYPKNYSSPSSDYPSIAVSIASIRSLDESISTSIHPYQIQLNQLVLMLT
jgi:hypothetical protein